MKILIIDDEITALTKLKVLLTAYGGMHHEHQVGAGPAVV